MRRLKFLENIVTADVAFEAYGRTHEELFENAALALFEVMVETRKVKPLHTSHFTLHTSSPEDLLYDFLSELIFLKDKEGVVFSKFKVKITPRLVKARGGRLPSLLNLNARIWGEKIDPKRHKLKVDVKAVTKHLLEIRKEKGKFIAQVVLDI